MGQRSVLDDVERQPEGGGGCWGAGPLLGFVRQPPLVRWMMSPPRKHVASHRREEDVRQAWRPPWHQSPTLTPFTPLCPVDWQGRRLRLQKEHGGRSGCRAGYQVWGGRGLVGQEAGGVLRHCGFRGRRGAPPEQVRRSVCPPRGPRRPCLLTCQGLRGVGGGAWCPCGLCSVQITRQVSAKVQEALIEQMVEHGPSAKASLLSVAGREQGWLLQRAQALRVLAASGLVGMGDQALLTHIVRRVESR